MTAALTRRYQNKPIFGGGLAGGSLWSKIKGFAKKLFGSKSVRDKVQQLGKLALKHAPGLIEKGLDKINPKLPWLPRQSIRDITKSLGELGKKKLESITQAPENMPGDLAVSAPLLNNVPVGAEPTKLGYGLKIAAKHPQAGRKAMQILSKYIN